MRTGTMLTSQRRRAARVSSIALGFLLSVASLADAQWLERRGDGYTIYYHNGFTADAEFADSVLRQVQQLALTKYRVSINRATTSFYLEPRPTSDANVNTAIIKASLTATGGSAQIYVLAPSAVEWRSAGLDNMGFPKDSKEYHAKLWTHEYITVAHDMLSRQPGRRWILYDAPLWFTEGLEDYDGWFRSTPVIATFIPNAISGWARQNATKIVCCNTISGVPKIVYPNEYSFGLAFVYALVQLYGEDIHHRILSSTERSFQDSLTALTRPMPELFQAVRSKLIPWLTPNPSGAAFLSTDEILDFGAVPSGTRVTKRLAIWNTGTAQLTVSRVMSSNMSCTTTVGPHGGYPAYVPPGSSDWIDFTCTIAAGPANNAGAVLTSNASNSSVTVRMIGTGQ